MVHMWVIMAIIGQIEQLMTICPIICVLQWADIYIQAAGATVDMAIPSAASPGDFWRVAVT